MVDGDLAGAMTSSDVGSSLGGSFAHIGFGLPGWGLATYTPDPNLPNDPYSQPSPTLNMAGVGFVDGIDIYGEHHDPRPPGYHPGHPDYTGSPPPGEPGGPSPIGTYPLDYGAEGTPLYPGQTDHHPFAAEYDWARMGDVRFQYTFNPFGAKKAGASPTDRYGWTYNPDSGEYEYGWMGSENQRRPIGDIGKLDLWGGSQLGGIPFATGSGVLPWGETDYSKKHAMDNIDLYVRGQSAWGGETIKYPWTPIPVDYDPII